MSLAILLAAGEFYWVKVRPIVSKRNCHIEAENKAKEYYTNNFLARANDGTWDYVPIETALELEKTSGTVDETKGYIEGDYKYFYDICLKRNGV